MRVTFLTPEAIRNAHRTRGAKFRPRDRPEGHAREHAFPCDVGGIVLASPSERAHMMLPLSSNVLPPRAQRAHA
jgi:hypothetical protein